MLRNKKITALLLVFVFLLTGMSTYAGQEAVNGDEQKNIEETVLTELGIISQDFLDEESAGLPTTRCEVVNAVIKMLYNDIPEAEFEFPFKDVDFYMIDAKTIQLAVNMGLVNGTSADTFEPERAVTLSETLKIVVSALGYRILAEEKGGYPSGYLNVAQQIGLTRGIDVSHDSTLSREQFVHLIYRALSAEVMTPGLALGNEISYTVKEDATILDSRDIYKVSGIVDAVPNTSLEQKEGIPKNSISINNVIYDCTDDKYSAYLGYYVDAYYQEKDDENEIVCIVPAENKNNVTEIDAELMDSYKDNKIYYYKSETDGKLRNITLSKYVDVIYNGKLDTSYTKADFIPESGKALFIDNDNDKTYDVVFITEYKNYFVKSVDKDNLIIYGDYGAGGLCLDPEKVDFVNIYRDGAKTEFTDISADCVVSAVVSKDGEYIEAYISADVVEGTVSEIREGISGSVAVINNEKYKISSQLEDAGKNIGLRHEGTFYLDINKNIAGFKTGGTGSFGYAMKCIKNTDGDSDCYMIKLLDEFGEIKMYELNDKIRVNGTQLSDERAAFCLQVDRKGNDTGAFYPQLISYTLNGDNQISSFYNVLCTDEEEFSLDYDTDDAETTDEFDKKWWYKSASKFFGVRFGGGADTVVFNVPMIKDTSDADEDDYSVMDMGVFINDNLYAVEGYCLDDTGFAEVLVNYIDLSQENLLYTTDTAVGIVNSVSEMADADGVATVHLSIFSGGRLNEINFDSDLKITDDNDIRKGCVIQYHVDGKGNIYAYKVLLDPNKETKPFMIEDRKDPVVDGMTYGKIYSKSATHIRVCSSLDATGTHYVFKPESMKTFNPSYGPIYAYSKSEQKVTVEKDLSKAVDYVTAGSAASTVFVRSVCDETRQTFLFID